MRFGWAVPLAGILATACGTNDGVPSTVVTPRFDGEYTLKPGPILRRAGKQLTTERDPKRRAGLQALTLVGYQMYRSLSIHDGVIRTGGFPVQEFSLQTATIDANVLRGTAIWHEDVHDPGDMTEVQVRLALDGDDLSFTTGDGEPDAEAFEYARR